MGIIKDWDARWYAEKDYVELLHEDLKVRDYIKKQLDGAGVSRIEIDRAANNLRINIHTAKPGMVIGRRGAGVDKLRRNLEEMTERKVHVNIMEIRTPELMPIYGRKHCAAAFRMIAFRRAMKQAVFRTMRAGAKGVKIVCSGRLADLEFARTEGYHEGTVPLQTLRRTLIMVLSNPIPRMAV